VIIADSSNFFVFFQKKFHCCYSFTLQSLQNNRPISVGIGFINTDNSLEIVSRFWYNISKLEVNILLGFFLMELPQINVAVKELTFSLFQRPLHPELFQIYADRHLNTEKYEAIIWVTGCTHVVSVFAGDACLTEVISTPGQMLPSRGLIERFQFSGPRTHKCTLRQGISYMTDFQVEKMSPSLYRQSHTDLELFARNRGVFVKFPKLEIGSLQPFCYIDFEARCSELHIHTFAAYPDQVTMIKTQSLFDFK